MLKQIQLFLLCLIMSTASYAVPVVTYDGGSGYATGILDLSVGGTAYDVDFVMGSFNSVYGADLPVFWGDSTGSDAAADAIMGALNAEPGVPEIGLGSSEVLWVPYQDYALSADSFRARQVGHDLDALPWIRYADFVGSKATDYSDAPYSWLFATFTPVPEPASLILMCLGLVGLGLLRRKG